MRDRLLAFVAMLALAASPACDDEADGDADTDADTDADADADGDADGDADSDAPPSLELDPERVYDDIAFLASDDLQGRAAGSEGVAAAQAYVEERFESLCLEPVGDDDGFRQPVFVGAEWRTSGPPTLALGERVGVEGTDYGVVDWSGSASIEAELVFAGYGIRVPPYDAADYPSCPIDPATGYDDYIGLEVDGRIVLVLADGPGGDEALRDLCPADEVCVGPGCLWTVGYKAAEARTRGASALIVVPSYLGDDVDLWVEGLVDFGYRDDAFPVLAARRGFVELEVEELPARAEAIDAALAPAGLATGLAARVSAEGGLTTIFGSNVIGALPGEGPEIGDEVVVVGAHVDHLGVSEETGEIFNGADDDASGVAVVMELARAFCGLEVAPARTLVFAAFDREEVDHGGSLAYVRIEPYPMESTVAMFSVDMVGAGDARGLELYDAEPDALWIAEVMAGSAAAQGLDLEVVPLPRELASDHDSFIGAGVPAVLAYATGVHPNYHTPDDDAEAIDLPALDASLRLMGAGLLPLAFGTEDEYLSGE